MWIKKECYYKHPKKNLKSRILILTLRRGNFNMSIQNNKENNLITIEFAQRMYKYGIALTIRNKKVIATLNK